MRHGKKFNHLGRKKGHRTALLKNMSNSLIEHKRINTTLAKAKALRLHLEPIITKCKTNTTHSRRVVFSYLQSKDSVKELFDNVAPRIADRPGGYLRIIKTGFRKGDAAELAMIEFVDYNTVYTNDKPSGGGKKKTRRRRGGAKKAAAATAAAVVADTIEEVVKGDDPEMDILMSDTVEESGTVVNEDTHTKDSDSSEEE
ncbi:MAG: 50S ribosomal protein L17 [Saprospiraceae bacterium]